MSGILPVWLGPVCRGDVNLGVQLLEQNEGMPVDIPSVSLWIAKEQDQEGTTNGGLSGSVVRKGGPRSKDGGSTVSPGSPVACAHLTSSSQADPCAVVAPGQE